MTGSHSGAIFLAHMDRKPVRITQTKTNPP
jgi:hypothetical protein